MEFEVDTKVEKETIWMLGLTLAIVAAFIVFMIKATKSNG